MHTILTLVNSLSNKNVLLIFFLLGLLVYANSLFMEFVIDDADYIVNNPLIRSAGNIPSFFVYGSDSVFLTNLIRENMGNFYRPLLMTHYTIVYSVFGQNQFGFRLLQILIHILNVWLFYLILKSFFRPSLAFVASLVFLVHPLNAEAVLPMGIADVLFFMFGSLSLLMTIKGSGRFLPFLVFFMLFLSLLAKETGAIFAAIVLSYRLLLKRNNFHYWMAGGALVFLVYFFLRTSADVVLENKNYSPMFRASFSERLNNMPYVAWYYMKSFIFPKDLSVLQQWIFTGVSAEFFLVLMILFVFLFGLGVSAVVLWRKRNFQVFAFFVIWFFAAFSLHLQIVPLYTTVADRWFYLPMAGLLGIICVFLNTRSLKVQKLFLIFVLLVLPVLCIRTAIRNANWSNDFQLYSHDIKVRPDNWLLYVNLGMEFSNRGKMEEAERLLKRSIELAPYAWINWNNLGNIYGLKGDVNKQKEYYLKAIENGDFEHTYANLAILLIGTEKPEVVKQFMEGAVKKFPHNSMLWRVLALVEEKLGNRELAVESARKAYVLLPDPGSYKLYTDLMNSR